jgi:hypothetical protein
MIKQRMRWVKHMASMEGGREGSAQKITVIKPDENKPLSALRHKWEDIIKTYF